MFKQCLLAFMLACGTAAAAAPEPATAIRTPTAAPAPAAPAAPTDTARYNLGDLQITLPRRIRVMLQPRPVTEAREAGSFNATFYLGDKEIGSVIGMARVGDSMPDRKQSDMEQMAKLESLFKSKEPPGNRSATVGFTRPGGIVGTYYEKQATGGEGYNMFNKGTARCVAGLSMWSSRTPMLYSVVIVADAQTDPDYQALFNALKNANPNR